ncbi:hypothetical protein BC940DRAFT_338132, partial [Gongronella butleri]
MSAEEQQQSSMDTRELAAQFAATLGQISPSGAASTTDEIPPHQARDYALLRDPVLHSERLDTIRQKKGYIIDMDGVIYHGNNLLPGAKEL